MTFSVLVLISNRVLFEDDYNFSLPFLIKGWWFVDLDSELGWVPASYLEPRDGSMDDQVLETFEEGEGRTEILVCFHRKNCRTDLERTVFSTNCRMGRLKS